MPPHFVHDGLVDTGPTHCSWTIRPRRWHVGRVFVPLVVIPAVVVATWWPLPVALAISAFTLGIMGLAGLVLFGFAYRVVVDADTVAVLTALGWRTFRRGQSLARSESQSTLLGTRSLRFLVLQRRDGGRSSVRVPLWLFSANDERQIVHAASAVFPHDGNPTSA